MTNVLFICSRNRLRSPTAEQVFSSWPGLITASAGINRGADTPLSAELLEWADLVFVMEPVHRRKVAEKSRACLGDTPLICLGIRDVYDYMDPDLLELLKVRVTPHLRGRH